MCIAIVCLTGDIMNYEINLIFLITTFSYMTKITRQKIKYLENETSFPGEIKRDFCYFSMIFICQNFSQI